MFSFHENFFEVVILVSLYFARVSALIMSMPVIGTHLVPRKIKLITSLAMTIFIIGITDLINDAALIKVVSQISLFQWILNIIWQILLGVMLGFAIQIIFQVFVVAGQIIAMQMGLGFAAMMDPQSGVSQPQISQLFLMMVSLIYLSINGHLYLFDALIKSFDTAGVILESFNFNNAYLIVKSGFNMFLLAVQIALPAIVALLLVSLTIGVMTKAAPQLNIFSIGFPITMLLGLIVLWINIVIIIPKFQEYFSKSDLLISTLIRST